MIAELLLGKMAIRFFQFAINDEGLSLIENGAQVHGGQHTHILLSF